MAHEAAIYFTFVVLYGLAFYIFFKAINQLATIL